MGGVRGELGPGKRGAMGILDAILIRPGLIVVFDTVEDTLTIVTPVRPEPGIPAKLALARAVDRVSAVIEDLDRPLDKEASDGDAGAFHVAPGSNTTPAQFEAMVRRATAQLFAPASLSAGALPRLQGPLCRA